MAGPATAAIELAPCETSQEWEGLLRREPGATAFHHPFWLDLLARHHGGQVRRWRIHADGKPIGLLAAILYRRGPLRIAAAPPGRTGVPYLGPVAPVPLHAAVLERFALVTKEERTRYVEVRLPHMLPETPFGYTVEERGHWALDLRPGADRLWKEALTSACRRAVRKAERSGVEIEHGDLLAHLDRYYDMACRVFARSDTDPPLSREDYRCIGEWALDGGAVEVLFARHEGEVVAGGIFPYDTHTVYYLDGASDTRHQSVRPNNLLHWEAIRRACARGATSYDMIAGTESINRFKRSFGCERQPYTYAFCTLDPLTTLARRAYRLTAPAAARLRATARRLLR